MTRYKFLSVPISAQTDCASNDGTLERDRGAVGCGRTDARRQCRRVAKFEHSVGRRPAGLQRCIRGALSAGGHP